MSLFKNYVTSTAFSLTLSRPMIECLSQLDQQGTTWSYLSTFSALESRGLVERYKPNDLPDELVGQLNTRCRLTKEGKAVIPLLKLSGLYVNFPDLIPAEHIPEPNLKFKEKA